MGHSDIETSRQYLDPDEALKRQGSQPPLPYAKMSAALEGGEGSGDPSSLVGASKSNQWCSLETDAADGVSDGEGALAIFAVGVGAALSVGAGSSSAS
jgi:hypothetical protein